MKKLTIANIITFGNIGFGLIAILFATRTQFVYSGIAILIGVMLDFFDGKIARLLKQESRIGEQLDSIADIVSFGIAPAVLVIIITGYRVTGLILALFFVVTGAYRLARFNVLKSEKKNGYIGLPITVNGVVIPIMVIAGIDMAFAYYAWLIAAGLLMIGNFEIRK